MQDSVGGDKRMYCLKQLRKAVVCIVLSTFLIHDELRRSLHSVFDHGGLHCVGQGERERIEGRELLSSFWSLVNGSVEGWESCDVQRS